MKSENRAVGLFVSMLLLISIVLTGCEPSYGVVLKNDSRVPVALYDDEAKLGIANAGALTDFGRPVWSQGTVFAIKSIDGHPLTTFKPSTEQWEAAVQHGRNFSLVWDGKNLTSR